VQGPQVLPVGLRRAAAAHRPQGTRRDGARQTPLPRAGRQPARRLTELLGDAYTPPRTNRPRPGRTSEP
jgi:hypothetical protein